MKTKMAAKIEASQYACERESDKNKAKRAKLDEEQTETGNGQFSTLSNVKFLRVLSNDVNTKTIFIQGKFRPI